MSRCRGGRGWRDREKIRLSVPHSLFSASVFLLAEEAAVCTNFTLNQLSKDYVFSANSTATTCIFCFKHSHGRQGPGRKEWGTCLHLLGLSLLDQNARDRQEESTWTRGRGEGGGGRGNSISGQRGLNGLHPPSCPIFLFVHLSPQFAETFNSRRSSRISFCSRQMTGAAPAFEVPQQRLHALLVLGQIRGEHW